jgi:hypothetical protein
VSKPRPEKDVVEDAAKVAKHNVKLLNYLKSWQQRELTELPLRTENVAVFQGRCQVLGELIEFLDEAPRIMAKS